MNSLVLLRDIRSEKQTQGKLFVMNDKAEAVFECFTLELPWRDNLQSISCIPEGRYPVKKRNSNKYDDHFHILDVEGRSYILIHEANFVRELRGCISIGRDRIDIDGDGLIDVTSSIATKKKLLDLLPDETEINISNI